jgi:hypothetical protein
LPVQKSRTGLSRTSFDSSESTRDAVQFAQMSWPARYSAPRSGQYFILVALDAEGHGVAAAEAERGDAAFEVAALQFI